MTAMPLALSATTRMASLPKKVRDEIDLLDRVFKRTMVARPRMAAYEAAAHELRAHGLKYTASGVRSLLTRYVASGCDPMELKDHRKVPHDDHKLPAAFVEEVKRRFQRNTRSITAAYLDLIEDWRAGKPMPGYLSSPAAHAYTDRPYGWTESNLRKVAKTSAFEKAAMRVGLGRARAKHGSKLFTTRAGLWPMSHVMPDDVVHDNFVHVLASRQLCRTGDLGFLDVLSGSRFFHGTKPLDYRLDPKTGAEVMNGWREESMRFATCAVLYQYGFSPKGTTFCTELGTAALRANVAQIMHDRTKELYGEALLHVDDSPITGKRQAIAGFFQGRGGGNPRHKSCLESLHNLIHNRLAALPAQTGPDTDRRPEQLHGLLNDAASLLKIHSLLSPYQQNLLKFPTLEYHTEFLPLLAAIYRQIDERTEHDLEGWADCGFLTDEYRFHRESKEWLSKDQYLALPGPTQAMLSQAVKDDKACHRPSRLSPRAVFQSGLGTLMPCPPSILAEILYDDLATARPVKGRYITFDDRTIAPEELIYHATVYTVDGRPEQLTEGEKYETVVNPFQPELLWVYSKRGDGSFLGIAQRYDKPTRGDHEAEARELHRIREVDKLLRAPLVRRHADLARQEARRLQNNADVINGPRNENEAQLARDRADRLPLPDDDIPSEAPTFDEL